MSQRVSAAEHANEHTPEHTTGRTLAHTPRVAVIGDNTIDQYIGSSSMVLVGGNALNVAVQLSNRQVDVAYFGSVGLDAYGSLIRSALESQGVDIAGLRVDAGDTAVTRIELTADRDRVFLSEDFGVTAEYRPSGDDLDRAAASGWVHLGMLPQADDVKQALRTRNPHLIISQDLSVTAGASKVNISFESGGEDADAAALAAEAIESGVSLAIVTRGADGAYATDGTLEWFQPALLADVVDTTGAGDSFIAGFIHSRMGGGDIVDALLSGARFATRTCGHVGGWPQPESKENQ